jgi:hypothetical protein
MEKLFFHATKAQSTELQFYWIKCWIWSVFSYVVSMIRILVTEIVDDFYIVSTSDISYTLCYGHVLFLCP